MNLKNKTPVQNHKTVTPDGNCVGINCKNSHWSRIMSFQSPLSQWPHLRQMYDTYAMAKCRIKMWWNPHWSAMHFSAAANHGLIGSTLYFAHQWRDETLNRQQEMKRDSNASYLAVAILAQQQCDQTSTKIKLSEQMS